MERAGPYIGVAAIVVAIIALIVAVTVEAPAVGTGTISGTITDATGAAIEGATVTTDPATTEATTGSDGTYTISDVPIGVYTVLVSKSGYEDKSQTDVSIAEDVTRTVDLALTSTGTATIAGTVKDTAGTAIEGATVTVSGTTLSDTTDSNGAYSISGVTAGFVYLDVTAPTGYLDGGTRDSTSLSAGQTTSGVDVTLSARPSDDATYVGVDTCAACHVTGLYDAWEGSAHNAMVQFDVTTTFVATGWPDTAGETDTGVDAKDHTGATGDVYVVNNGDGTYSMRINGNTYDVFGTMGGNHDVDGDDVADMWKQRYLTRDEDVLDNLTANVATDGHYDVLILPVQWNIETGAWAGYHTDDWYEASRTWSKKCGGCHTTGTEVTVDDAGLVTAWDYTDLNVSCESCHGPGSEHVAAGGGLAEAIINPNYITQEAEVELCGQCHSRGNSVLISTEPDVYALGYPWKADSTTAGAGNFVPGVDSLADFYTQSPSLWTDPVEHSSSHHQQYNDFLKSEHYDNPYHRVTCSSCHSPHSASVGPYHFYTDDYMFKEPSDENNVLCLACHAPYGDFSDITKDDVAAVHYGAQPEDEREGSVTKDDEDMTFTDEEIAAAQAAIADAVVAHMNTRASMGSYVEYDPEGTGVGRCTSCHMPDTAKSGVWTSGTNYFGEEGKVSGDISSHVFDVVTPQTGEEYGVPNSCAACHPRYIYPYP